MKGGSAADGFLWDSVCFVPGSVTKIVAPSTARRSGRVRLQACGQAASSCTYLVELVVPSDHVTTDDHPVGIIEIVYMCTSPERT